MNRGLLLGAPPVWCHLAIPQHPLHRCSPAPATCILCCFLGCAGLPWVGLCPPAPSPREPSSPQTQLSCPSEARQGCHVPRLARLARTLSNLPRPPRYASYSGTTLAPGGPLGFPEAMRVPGSGCRCPRRAFCGRSLSSEAGGAPGPKQGGGSRPVLRRVQTGTPSVALL